MSHHAYLSVATSLLLAGCGNRSPPPVPPEPAHIVPFSLGDIEAVDSRQASHLMETPVKLTTDATLRVNGNYRFVDEKKDVPVFVSITRQERGQRATYSGSGTSDLRLKDGHYSFTVDVPAPQSTGNFDLDVRAGERYIAHGTVVVAKQ